MSSYLVCPQILNLIKVWTLTRPLRFLGLNYNVSFCEALYINQAFPAIINLTALICYYGANWPCEK